MTRTLRQSLFFVLWCIGGIALAGGGFVGGYSVGYLHGEHEARYRYQERRPLPQGGLHPFELSELPTWDSRAKGE